MRTFLKSIFSLGKKQQNGLPNALKIYENTDFAIQQKAKFIYYMIFAVFIGEVFLLGTATYLQLIMTGGNGVYLPALLPSIITLFVIAACYILLIKGFYSFSTHLVMITSILSVWFAMWFDNSPILGKLDTVVIVLGILFLAPLFINRFKSVIVIYILSNILILIGFMMFWGSKLGLANFDTLEYLIDNIISFVFIGVVGYNIFVINKKTVDRAMVEISERKLSEKSLKESELFRQRVFEGSRISIVIMDAITSKYIDCNPAAIQIYGFSSREATLGKTPLEVSAPIQYDGTPSSTKALNYINIALEEGSVVFEWKHQRPNGEFWDGEVHLMSFQLGEKTFLQFSIVDITKRKQAENALKESEESHRKLIEALPDMIMQVDLKGNILYGNEPFERITGITPNDYNNLSRKARIHPDDYIRVSEAIKEFLLQNKSHSELIENRFIDTWGSIHWFSGRVTKLFINNEIVLQTVTRDITENKKNELELNNYRNHLELLVQERTDELATTNEELQSANEELFSQREELQNSIEKLHEAQRQLIQSEKMASLGVLSAGIAHEINNPLNFIHGGILSIENYINENLPEHLLKVEFMLNAVNTGVKRASNIVTSLSHYSRKDDLPAIDCNIHEIIDNSLVMLQNKLKHKVEVKKQYTDESCVVFGNEGKLHQAFLNIISNAEQAIGDTGTIEIETKLKHQNIVIIITDSGDGIKPENIQKIFDPFFTTKDPGKGTGLGMAITYNIIQEHQGTIEYESNVGLGTKVIISLPKHF